MDDELVERVRAVLAKERPHTSLSANDKAQLLRELGLTEHNVDEVLSLEEETD